MDCTCLEDPKIIIILILGVTFLAIWEMIWKGFALWTAGNKKDAAWFICIFIFNTMGILPIIYILKNKKKEE